MSHYLLSAIAGVAVLAAAYALTGDARATDFRDLLARKRPAADQHLAYGKKADQFGDLYVPAGEGPHPLVVMIHGGCWQASLPGAELMAYIADDLRSSGVAVWNIEYRRLGTRDAGYPGTFLDIADGMDYLNGIAPTYKLDLSHITVVGHSAGGQLALWAAARPRIAKTSPLYRSQPLPVEKVVTLAGINDLLDYRDRGLSACGGARTIDQLIAAGKRRGEDPYADTSPAAMLPLNHPQVIISGDSDPIVPPRFGERYAKKAQAIGDKVEVLTIAKSGHFELIDPTSDAWTQIKPYLLNQ